MRAGFVGSVREAAGRDEAIVKQRQSIRRRRAKNSTVTGFWTSLTIGRVRENVRMSLYGDRPLRRLTENSV